MVGITNAVLQYQTSRPCTASGLTTNDLVSNLRASRHYSAQPNVMGVSHARQQPRYLHSPNPDLKPQTQRSRSKTTLPRRTMKLEDAFEDLDSVDDTPLAPETMQLSASTQPTTAPSCSTVDRLRTDTPSAETCREDRQGSLTSDPSQQGGHGSSSNGRAGAISGHAVADDSTSQGTAAATPTEMIFKLERRGTGWGEEIFPHLVVENRALYKEPIRCRTRSTQPDPWQEGSLEDFLENGVGIAAADVDSLVQKAIVWRITPGGRSLLDRRRRSRVERNVYGIVQHLAEECHLRRDQIAAVLQQWPQIMLCKPSHHDRFDRRVVSLAAFRLVHGHLDVPENYELLPDLPNWIKRMRISRASGVMCNERQQVLEALGFEFGEVAQITDEWEIHFDQLLEWLSWRHDESNMVLGGQKPGWCGADWAQQGGPTAGELALWTQLQRELKNRGLIEPEAFRRLDAVGFDWAPEDMRVQDRTFMTQLGRLVLCAEKTRHAKAAEVTAVVAALQERDAQHSEFGALLSGASADADLEHVDDLVAHGFRSLQPSHTERGPSGRRLTRDPRKLSRQVSGRKAGRPTQARSEGIGAPTIEDLSAQRRAALHVASLDPGLGYWIARQRWLWRRNRLPHERLQMLQLAGVCMDETTPRQWRILAHTAVRFVTGFCAADSVPDWPTSRRQPPPPKLQPCRLPQRALKGSRRASSARTRSATDTALQMQPTNAVAVRRWVLTQKALVEQGTLSAARLRYLTLLGMTWLLSDGVVAMRPDLWKAHYEQVVSAAIAAAGSQAPTAAPSPGLREWLAHQKGLHRLGMLPPRHVQLLEVLRIQWQPQLTASEARWQACFCHLVAFARQHNHCQVPKDMELLAEWLDHQAALWRSGRLPAMRQASLRALVSDMAGPCTALSGSPSSTVADKRTASFSNSRVDDATSVAATESADDAAAAVKRPAARTIPRLRARIRYERSGDEVAKMPR